MSTISIIAAAFVSAFIGAVVCVEVEHRVAEWWHRRKKGKGQ